LLVVVQVDLHEEGHNTSRNQGGFTEACLQFRLSKAGRPLRAAEISKAPRVDRLSPRSVVKKGLARPGPSKARLQVRGRKNGGIPGDPKIGTWDLDPTHYLLGCCSECRVRRSRIRPVAVIAIGRFS
jgi:hypothetical protein